MVSLHPNLRSLGEVEQWITLCSLLLLLDKSMVLRWMVVRIFSSCFTCADLVPVVVCRICLRVLVNIWRVSYLELSNMWSVISVCRQQPQPAPGAVFRVEMCAGAGCWAGGGVVQQESKVSIRCWPSPVYLLYPVSAAGRGGMVPHPPHGCRCWRGGDAGSREPSSSVVSQLGRGSSTLHTPHPAVSTSCDNTVSITVTRLLSYSTPVNGSSVDLGPCKSCQQRRGNTIVTSRALTAALTWLLLNAFLCAVCV